MPRTLPRLALHRRAVLIYLGAIVTPVCALLWLGLESFERQREAVEALTSEKLEGAIETAALAAADSALTTGSHPAARHFFVVDRGVVITPALRAPLPRPLPDRFAAAERLELALQRPDLALARYQALLADDPSDSLAMQFVARTLGTVGRPAESRAMWRTLATRFPNDRDLAHRPYGIVAAINAGETTGLFEQISSGRWELTGDQAAHFLATLGPGRHSPYLERFEFARALEEQFHPAAALRPGQVYGYTFDKYRIFYRVDSQERVSGFAVDPQWMEALRLRLQAESSVTDTNRQAVALYGGALAVVLLVLSGGMIVLFRDVSREARINQLRSDFVNGVTHELKTPITIMRLYGETLLRQRNLAETERRDFYRIISRESTRLGRLVDQVLTFSRVERGDIHYDLQLADMAPVVAGIVDDYSDWLEHAGFVVERTLPATTAAVRFEPAALSQALLNLLDNAAKYSGASRTIGVRLTSSAGHVAVEVEDHGIGIAQADRARIFDRFYRATNDSGKGGYGLGLYMVRHIMDAHGGRAEVESEPGQGSRFRLIFPIASP